MKQGDLTMAKTQTYDRRDFGLYDGKRHGTSHLLGGVASVLTGGNVKRVDVDRDANTGFCQFDAKDGKTVRRIVMPSPEKLPEGITESAMRGFLDHESAHAIWSDFVGFKPANPMEQTVTNIIEDPRVERLMCRRYVGSKENISDLNTTMSGLIEHKAFNEAEPTKQILTALSVALVSGPQALEDEILSWAEYAEDLRAVLDVVLPIGERGAKALNSKGAYEAAREVIAAIAKLQDPEEQPPSPDPAKGGDPEQGDAEGDGEGSGSPAPGSAKGGKPSPGKGKGKGKGAPKKGEDEGEGEEKAKGDGEGQEPSSSASGAQEGEGQDGEGAGASPKPEAGEGENESASGTAEPSNAGHSTGKTKGLRTRLFVKKAREHAEKGEIPENMGAVALADMAYEAVKEAIEEAVKEEEAEEAKIEARMLRTGLYKPTYPWTGKDKEVVVKKTQTLEENYARILAPIKNVANALRTMLRVRILSEGKTKIRHGKADGPMISSKTLAALATGTSDHVFASYSRGKSRKTAISLLLDGSGSMNGAPVALATQTAMAFAEALRGLPGITFEVNGFEYTGTQVRYCLKPFASRDNTPIVSFYNHDGNGNDDGLAVRWAARRLLRERADRRILIVLSDGWPSDPSGGDVNSDLKSAVGACERAGIETVGIGIVSEAVKSFYPKYVVVKDIKDLTGTVLRELGKLFDPAAAEKGRRAAKQLVA